LRVHNPLNKMIDESKLLEKLRHRYDCAGDAELIAQEIGLTQRATIHNTRKQVLGEVINEIELEAKK